MPIPPRTKLKVAHRARYTRTSGDLMKGGWEPTEGINPSGQPPIYWMGLDSGGLSYPIGPHGPWTNGYAAGLPVVTRATSLITGPLTAAPFRVLELGFGGQPTYRPRWITDPMLLRPDARYAEDVYPEVVKLPRSLVWRSWIAESQV